MKSIIRNLTAPAEFFLIVVLWAGAFIATGTVAIVRQIQQSPVAGTATTFHVPNKGVLLQIVYELLTLSVILWIGRIRGWSLKTFGLRPSWKWTGVGILLFFVVGLTARLIGMLIKFSSPPLPSVLQSRVVSELSLPFIVLISVVNPVFEESLWGGYFVHALKRYGMWVAVLASALLRTFCHAHLGIRALVSILPQGVIYGLVYWRWRQLWPLVVAHSLQMLFSLLGQLYGVSPTGDSQTRYQVCWYVIGFTVILVCAFMAWLSQKNRIHVNDAA